MLSSSSYVAASRGSCTARQCSFAGASTATARPSRTPPTPRGCGLGLRWGLRGGAPVPTTKQRQQSALVAPVVTTAAPHYWRTGGRFAPTPATSGAASAAPPASPQGEDRQQQQAERRRAFWWAAAKVLPAVEAVSSDDPLPAVSAFRTVPPPPPPLTALPSPLPADSIPPLLDWVTSADLRPTAVMSIFEQHCNPRVRGILEAALEIAREEERHSTGALDLDSTAPWMTSAHVVLAALAAGYGRAAWYLTNAEAAELKCCGAVAGVLHHSADLPLLDCIVALSERAVEERRRAENRPPQEVLFTKIDGDMEVRYYRYIEHSTPETLHLIMQAYRWAVFTGCDAVQPCHLLWAMAADPRTSYSLLRTDPLDGRLLAAEVREPPLVWLLEQQATRLSQPAVVYQQLLCVLQRALNAAAQAPAGGAEGSEGSGVGSSISGFSPLTAKHGRLRKELEEQLLDKQAPCHLSELNELGKVLHRCREAGLVPSRGQLQAPGASLQILWQSTYLGTRSPHEHEFWAVYIELVRVFAALGYRLPVQQQLSVVQHHNRRPPKRRRRVVTGGSCPRGNSHWAAPSGNDETICPLVQYWCACDVALRACCAGASARKTGLDWLTSSGHEFPAGGPLLLDPVTAFDAGAQQALLAAADSLQTGGVLAHSAWLVPFVSRCVALHRQALAAAAATEAAAGVGAAASLPTRPADGDLAAQRRCLLAFLASPAGTWLVRQELCRIEDFCSISAEISSGSSSDTGGGGSSMTITEVAQVLRETVPLARRAWLWRELSAWSSSQTGFSSGVQAAWIAAVWASLAEPAANIHGVLLGTQRRSDSRVSPSRAKCLTVAQWLQQQQQDEPMRTLELRGVVFELQGTPQTPDSEYSPSLPRAEQDAALAASLAALGWQPLRMARPPAEPGVYWLGLRPHGASDEEVVPLYHGTSGNLRSRRVDHQRGMRRVNSKARLPLYWGLRVAEVVGTVVVACKPMASAEAAEAAEAAELRRRNYAFNSAGNGGPRVRQGLLAVGLTAEELDAVWSRQLTSS